MTLSQVEKQRISDSRLKVQSIARSLKQVDPNKIPNFQAIEDCLEDTNKSLGEALGTSLQGPPRSARK